MNDTKRDSTKPPVLVHYLPWYRCQGSRPDACTWAHWHGFSLNTPFACQEIHDGTRKIASRYYPSRGPYDSNDPGVIDQHLDEIEASGITGIILDWYGVGRVSGEPIKGCDFYGIHNCCLEIIRRLSRHPAMKYAICFDRNYELIINGPVKQQGFHQDFDHTEYTITSIQYLVDKLLPSSHYFTLPDGTRPILVFGRPENRIVNWDELSPILHSAKQICVLSQDEVDLWSDGAFAWLPVQTGPNVKPFEWSQVTTAFEDFNKKAAEKKDKVFAGIAFPGVDDVYHEDGNPDRHLQPIDRENGEILRRTLDLARKSDNIRFIQIATYNDWNEGTQIEPSLAFGSRELETIRVMLKGQE